MKFPYVVCPLDDQLVRRWQKHYEMPSGRNLKLEEGLWRRTQDPRNAEESGWRGLDDCRRRLFHYRYTYDLVDRGSEKALGLVSLYIMYCITYPRDEVAGVRAAIDRSLSEGGWRRRSEQSVWECGSLEAELLDFERHPKDLEVGARLPGGYCSLEVTIRSRGEASGPVERNMPWDVLRRGMRVKDRREEPELIPDLGLLERFLPFHVEVGCGLSMESGIPPLHYLHDLYRVSNRSDNTFVLGEDDDVIPRLLASPKAALRDLTHMYRSCFLAEPSAAHRDLKTLADRGLLVGPVMTNNVDALLARTGLRELHLRRYDQDIPHVDFDPRAKALVVIGSHADRRRVQRRARDKGLQVFFIDPEGYWENDRFTPYPLEGARSTDCLCHSAAGPVLRALVENIVLQPRLS